MAVITFYISFDWVLTKIRLYIISILMSYCYILDGKVISIKENTRMVLNACFYTPGNTQTIVEFQNYHQNASDHTFFHVYTPCESNANVIKN